MRNLLNRFPLLGAVATVAILAGTTFHAPAYASGSSEGGAARVSIAGKLRLTTQEVMSLSCEAVHGSSDEIADKLSVTSEKFSKMLDALSVGDAALGVKTAEETPRVLRHVDRLRKHWNLVNLEVAKILAKTGGQDALNVILEADEQLLDDAETLLATMISNYSDTENFPPETTMAINIADRQTMLLEEIAKDECLLNSDDAHFDTHHAILEKHIKLFENSMQALHDGAPQFGLIPPPTNEIKMALEIAKAEWAAVLPMILAEGVAHGDPDRVHFSDRPETQLLRQQLKNTKAMYLLATSHDPDLFMVPLRQYTQEQLLRWLLEPQIVITLREQNELHADLTQADIDEMDKTWRAERESGDHKLVAEMLDRPISKVLRAYQERTHGIVTEVSVMDNRGLNVGQSELTSDIWQGDEDKFLKTYETENDGINIGEAGLDESTGHYQTQVSMPIKDPITGDQIGAITFGINIEPLL